MADNMTDKQFKTILEMFGMILDGCKDLEEAKKKVEKLLEEQKNKSEQDLEYTRGGRACHRSPIYKDNIKLDPTNQGGRKEYD